MTLLQDIARRDESTTSSLTGDRAKHHVATDPKKAKDPSSPRQIVLGLVFGIIFGFLLQKGGVAKYHVLMGVLLLEDMTVVKVMLSAILVGMIGVFALYGLRLVKLHVKPTRYAANVIGGLVFGVGFALLGYCPGTGSAALGQGNFDALFGIAGLMAGSYIYAELSAGFEKTVLKWGDRGKLTFFQLLRLSIPRSLLIFVPALVVLLVLINRLSLAR